MNNVWTVNNVNRVHCELSTYCNAICPNCPRYFPGTHTVRSGVTLSQVYLEDFKKWFSASFIRGVMFWQFCGTHGDPMMAKDVIDIVRYIFEINPRANIFFNTNGGIRSEEDWTTLGKISRNYNLVVTFSIDGLEDTNHIYRRNVNWKKLITNVTNYIDAGGRADWDFLVFRHNEHQIEEAKALSKMLGFSNFFPKRALGFESNGKLTDMPAFKPSGEFEYSILPPINSEYKFSSLDSEIIQKNRDNLKNFYTENIDKSLIEYQELVDNFKDESLDNLVEINCYSKRENKSEIYVNVRGIVFPCCFIGNSIDSLDNQPHALQLKNRFKNFDVENFNLNKKSIYEILELNYLNKLTVATWETSNCLKICKKTCGDVHLVNRVYQRD
mgnify:CR=1 FL=1